MNRLVKYLGVILKWRRLIFWNTVILTALAVIVSFILPPRYTATAQLLPPSDENDMFGLTSILGGGVGSGLSRLKAGLAGATTASDLMIGILSSRTVMQHVAERCSIGRHYQIRKSSPEKAVRQLEDITRLAASDDGIVRISVEARSRVLAAQVANTFVSELDSFLRYSNISHGHNMRVFVEHRLVQVDSSLAAARDSLRVFQQAHKVVTVDDETRVAIDAYARMRSQLSAKEADLEAARAAASDDNPYVVNLKREIAASRDELGKLESGSSGTGFGVGFGVSFKSLPAVAAEFARRYQDFRIQEEAYASLYQQYEYAKILEARDAPALTVLDYAVPPERRSFPRRAAMVVAVFLFSLFFGTVLAFLSEYFSYVRANRPDEYEGWQYLRGEVAASLSRIVKFGARRKS